MTRWNLKLFLVVLLMFPMLTGADVLAAPGLGALTVCKGVEGPELNPVNATNTFEKNTPFLHAVAQITDPTPGTKITGKWISVDAISTPNYVIAALDLVIKERGARNAHFELSKPDKGWPVGNYRVDIYIDGNKAGSAAFSIR